MDIRRPEKDIDPALRRLYPRLTDDELREAEVNLLRYAEVVLRIACRLVGERDNVIPRGALTGPDRLNTMKAPESKAE